MTQTIRAHFDGRSIIPDRPVNLPENEGRPGKPANIRSMILLDGNSPIDLFQNRATCDARFGALHTFNTKHFPAFADLMTIQPYAR